MSADLGPFTVSAETAEVAALRRATGQAAESEGLPFTWPIRWLARPEIRAALVALMPESDLVPFHESQTFDYAAPLEAGVSYSLAVGARREHDPERLVVEATIAASDGARKGTAETVLRLFPTNNARE